MHTTVTSVSSEQWMLYQQAVMDIQFGARTVRVTPSSPGTAEGLFPDSIGRTIHVITAFNPHGRVAPADANGRARRLLLNNINQLGLTWWPAAGGTACGAHIEESAAVVGMSDAAARELGRRFGQDAVFAWTFDAWRLLSCTSEETAVYGWTTTTRQVPATSPSPA
ncbi:DUF3293 domain-containing protein [Streptomyces sp. NPDC004393]